MIVTNGRDCSGCACSEFEERGVSIESNSGAYSATATAYAAGMKRSTFCLPRNDTYRAQAFDVLGQSWDGGTWSVVFMGPELPLDVTGFEDVVHTPDGATHYLGRSVDGNVSEPIIVRIAAASPAVSIMRENRAEGGGGGGAIFIADGGEPNSVLTTGLEYVRFDENVAAYGPNFATPPRFLEVFRQARPTPSGEAAGLDRALVVQLKDGYNQTAAISRDTGTVRIPDSTSLASLSGGTVVPFIDGFANFTELRVTSTPGSSITVVVSTSLDSLELDAAEVTTVITSKDCASGEEKTTTQCIPCPESEFSFYPDEACRDCPTNAECRSGLNSVIPDRGYWKSAWDSTKIRRCPHHRSCNKGSHTTDLIEPGATNASSTYLHPDAQCASHHHGPLCAVCKTSYVLSSGECRKCKRSHRRGLEIALGVILGVSALAVLATRCCCRDKALNAAVWDWCYAMGAPMVRYETPIQESFKLLVVFYDITSKLSQYYPSVRVPSSLEKYQLITAIFGLDIAAYLRRACFRSFDHVDLLYGATLIPVAVIMFLGTVVALSLLLSNRSVKDHVAIKSRASFFILFFLYLILTTTSRIIIRTLVCDDNFDDGSEEAHSPFYKDAYLYADYSISCQTRRYRTARVYAIVMLFVYPIGIPSLYLAILLRIKDRIAPADPAETAKRTVAEAAGVEERYEASGQIIKKDIATWRKKPSRSLSTSFIVKTKELKGRLQQRNVDRWRRALSLAKAVVAELDGKLAGESHDILNDDDAESLSKTRLAKLGNELILETRSLDTTVSFGFFLFDGFRVPCWGWIVLETLERIVLTCLLPFPGTDPDSFSQCLLGAGFTLVFSALYSYIKPFTSPGMSFFAACVNFIIILNYFGMMLLFVDQNLSDQDDTTGLKGKHVAGFLLCTNVGVAPLCGLATLFLETDMGQEFLRSMSERGRDVSRGVSLYMLDVVLEYRRSHSTTSAPPSVAPASPSAALV